MRHLTITALLLTTGCATIPAATTATVLTAVAPVAADVLAEIVRKRFGEEPDHGTAQCIEMPELDDAEWGYAICKARPVE